MRRYSWQWLVHDETGGGTPPQPPQFIQPPPPQVTPLPAPDVGETSRQLFQSQLEFNPQLTAQAVQQQQQFAPQLAQLQTDIQGTQAPQLLQQQLQSAQQFTPQFRSLIESQFPQIPILADQITQGLAAPSGLPPEQQAAQDAIRQRAREQVARNIQTSSNIGGTLFGGRRQLREDRAQQELQQGFAAEDIQRSQQERVQRLSELAQLFQVAGFQVQQPQAGIPGVPQFGQSVTPTGDSLLNALTTTNLNPIINPSVFQPGTQGTPGFFGQSIQSFGR